MEFRIIILVLSFFLSSWAFSAGAHYKDETSRETERDSKIQDGEARDVEPRKAGDQSEVSNDLQTEDQREDLDLETHQHSRAVEVPEEITGGKKGSCQYHHSPCTYCPVQGPVGPPGPPGRDGEPGKCNCPDVPGSSPGQSKPTIGSGVVYTRWGRRDCPDTADVVYKGVAAGAYYSHKGSGSNYLCLPDEPIYKDPVSGTQSHRGFVYGAEYQTNEFSPLLDILENDVPCVVCKATNRFTKLMIPARNICPTSAWTLEYSGYIMSSHYGHARTEFICMDGNPEAIPRSVHNSNGALFYLVEGRCGSSGSGLPCGPYVNGNELTCAVCTM